MPKFIRFQRKIIIRNVILKIIKLKIPVPSWQWWTATHAFYTVSHFTCVESTLRKLFAFSGAHKPAKSTLLVVRFPLLLWLPHMKFPIWQCHNVVVCVRELSRDVTLLSAVCSRQVGIMVFVCVYIMFNCWVNGVISSYYVCVFFNRYVLPNHMMLQIAESLPREMQGILACCNPIPPLVRQNLITLHNIILESRNQPLVKVRASAPGLLFCYLLKWYCVWDGQNSTVVVQITEFIMKQMKFQESAKFIML
jgi:hypothetical protein